MEKNSPTKISLETSYVTSLCSSDEAERLLGSGVAVADKTKDLRRQLWMSCAGNAILLIISVVLGMLLLTKRCKDPSLGIWSPANEAVIWREHRFQPALGQPTEYIGYPDDDTDKRWQELYQYNTSVITAQEARKLKNPTMAIPGTDQYLIELEVFHNLHCLDELRKMLYPERYGLLENFKLPDGSINRTAFGYKHWEHCADSLRQAIMCNADISPISYHVNVPFNRGVYPRLATTHTCRDFAAIQSWAKKHHAPHFQRRIYNFTRLQEIIDATDIDHSTEEDLQSHPDLFPGDEYFHYWREHKYLGEKLRPQIYPTKDHRWERTLWG